jgi:RHS repeat-associated protein
MHPTPARLSAACPRRIPRTRFSVLERLAAWLLLGSLALPGPLAQGRERPDDVADADSASRRASAAALAPESTAGLTRGHLLPAGWQLMSVPLQAIDPRPQALFAGLGQALRLHDYVAGQTLGVGEPGARSFSPGRAYWLLLTQPFTLSVEGAPVSVVNPQRVPLVPGWNAVATPWLTAVEWNDAQVSVRVDSETLPLSEAVTRGWLESALTRIDPSSGVYAPAAANASPPALLQPWEGALVFAQVAGELVFAPPPPDTQPPTLSLDPQPVDGQALTAPTPVIGTIDDANLAEWRLELAQVGSSDFVTVARGDQPVTQAVIGTLDPTLLLNGQYQVRLLATDLAGQTSFVTWTVVVKDKLKVGNFSISMVDLEVPLVGLPIRLTRTYDSRDKGRGDFGVGWRLEITNVRLAESSVLGENWASSRSGGLFPNYCLQQAKPHVVTVTWPTGKVYEFEPTVSPQCQQILPPRFVDLGFRALPGTTAKLEALGLGELLVEAGWPGPARLIDTGDVTSADPTLYRFTLPDGRAYVIHQQNGVQSITDLSGNTLSVSPAGIVHSSGTGVAFTRDALGRITRITDPAGNAMTYTYDAAGDLASFSDRENNTSTYTYDDSHGLLSYRDGRGIQPVRNDYDAAGRLIRHTDALGHSVEFTHDLNARRQVVRDRLGRVSVHEYDSHGNVVRETDASGRVTTRTFDARNNRTAETGPDGRTTTFTWDAADNRTSVADGLGNTRRYTYNALGQVTSETEPGGAVSTFSYDAAGNLTNSTDPLGQTVTQTFDAAGNPLTSTDALGHVTSYAYDTRGFLTRETDALGRVTTYTHDANGNRLTATRTRSLPGGGSQTLTTTYTYDKTGRLVQTQDPDGSLTRNVYDPIGNVVASIDKLGRTTSYTHDGMGRVLTATFPDGTFERQDYDADGRRSAFTDRGGRVTRFEYDLQSKPTRTVFPDGATLTNVNDPIGRPLTRTDERGQVTTFEYDAAGRQIKATDALGGVTQWSYDADGNRVALTDAAARTTSYEYDALARPRKVIYADGSFVLSQHDALGRVLAETDEAGRVTRYEYDALGQLTKVIDALGQETLYTYDEVGNRVSQTDALGRVTRFEHDALGRLLRRVLPDGSAETHVYDIAGRRSAHVDFNGRTTTFAFDAADRVTQRTYADGSSVAFTYTPTGQRASASDARGTTSYLYDARDRLLRLVQPDGRALGYRYDGAGNRLSLSASVDGRTLVTNYSYDALGRPSAVTDARGLTYVQTHDAVGNRLITTLPNGVQTSYTYDARHRLTALSSLGGAGLVQSQAYTLDATGRRTRVLEHDGSERVYTYDALYRLSGESVTGGAGPHYSKTFGYDAVGNRLTQVTTGAGAGTRVSSYDERDRLTLQDGAPLGYDTQGRLLTTSSASYVWSDDQRLARVTRADGMRIEHAYDADGNRVRTTLTPPTGPPRVTDYLVDVAGALSHVVAESDGATGALGAHYVRAGHELLAVLRPAGAGLDARYYHADALGSVRALSDESGAVSDRYTTTAFGELLLHTGSDPQPYLFAGEPYDPVSELSYNRARWLEPQSGRFLGIDFIEGFADQPRGRHLYDYAWDDPVNRRDPSGLISFGIAGLSISINIQGNLRASSGVASQAALNTVRNRILSISIRPYSQVQRVAGREVHHLIEQRLWRSNPALQRIFTKVHDIPSVSLTPAQHQAFTNAWRAAFPYSNQAGHVAAPTLEQIIAAAQTIYAGQPIYFQAIFLALI